MRIARVFDTNGELRHAILRENEAEFLTGDLLGSWQPSGVKLPVNKLRSAFPLDPPNVLCLGKNYRSFPGEVNPKFPAQPLLFMKSTSAVIGPDDTVQLPSIAPAEVYFEAELAVIIGHRAWNVSPSDAADYILGYTVANDLGARDCQAADGQWARAKSFDTFCPLGPWIETELDPASRRISCRLNGKLVQDSNTSLMIFGVCETVSFLSRCMTLLPGTVICMGSPGVLEEPRPLLKPGDVIEAEVEGIGVLKNPVAAAQACNTAAESASQRKGSAARAASSGPLAARAGPPTMNQAIARTYESRS